MTRNWSCSAEQLGVLLFFGWLRDVQACLVCSEVGRVPLAQQRPPDGGCQPCRSSPGGLARGSLLVLLGAGDLLDDQLIGMAAGERGQRQVGYVGISHPRADRWESRRVAPGWPRIGSPAGGSADGRSTASRRVLCGPGPGRGRYRRTGTYTINAAAAATPSTTASKSSPDSATSKLRRKLRVNS